MTRIPMNGLEYQFNEGKVTEVKISYRQYEGGNSFSSTVSIRPEDLEEGQEIDDLSRIELDEVARSIMVRWIEEASLTSTEEENKD